jgi:hypothetical protein
MTIPRQLALGEGKGQKKAKSQSKPRPVGAGNLTPIPASERESRSFEKTMRSLVFMTPKRQEPELPFRQKGSQN